MSWRQISENDFRSAITDAEDTAVRTRRLAAGQSDPFIEIRAQVTAEFRGAVRTAGGTLDGDASTLPPDVIFHAVAILRQRLWSRFGISSQSEDRKKEYDAAVEFLKTLREGGYKPEAPDAAADSRQTLAPPAIPENSRVSNWRDQDGI